MRRLGGLLVTALLGTLAFCQTQEYTAQEDGTPTISKRVDEVNLLLSVTNSKGKFVSDLVADELQILDNHNPPEKLCYFRARTEIPLRVILMIDVSSSVHDRFRFEQEAAAAFLKRVLRPSVDRAAVVGFGTEVHWWQDLTDQPEQLKRAIDSLQPGGETALFDAITSATGRLQTESETETARRVIILITDGKDTHSQANLQLAIEAAVRSEAVILALDSNIPSEKHSAGTKALHQLAELSGGFVLPATEKSDLKQAFHTAELFLRNQYAIGYRPADLLSNGIFRGIEITSTRRKLHVHSRAGYYSPSN